MMNVTQSFEEFSRGVGAMDLALYAGLALIIWIFTKDRLAPIQQSLLKLFAKDNPLSSIVVTQPTKVVESEDVFFQLVASWKQTRDLAVKSGCSEAIKVADQMFPHLSPNACSLNKGNVV